MSAGSWETRKWHIIYDNHIMLCSWLLKTPFRQIAFQVIAFAYVTVLFSIFLFAIKRTLQSKPVIRSWYTHTTTTLYTTHTHISLYTTLYTILHYIHTHLTIHYTTLYYTHYTIHYLAIKYSLIEQYKQLVCHLWSTPRNGLMGGGCGQWCNEVGVSIGYYSNKIRINEWVGSSVTVTYWVWHIVGSS